MEQSLSRSVFGEVFTGTGPMNNRKHTICIAHFFVIAVFCAGLLATGSVRAQEIGDTAEGHKLAENWCSSCHVIGPTQQQGVSNGAPTFAAVARMKSTTTLSLYAFLQTPHDRMPDLHLSRDDIDNISAYILSLRHK